MMGMGLPRCAASKGQGALPSRKNWIPPGSRICPRARSPADASILFFRPRILPKKLGGLLACGSVHRSQSLAVGIRAQLCRTIEALELFLTGDRTAIGR